MNKTFLTSTGNYRSQPQYSQAGISLYKMYHKSIYKKGKAIPLQAWTGPKYSRSL